MKLVERVEGSMLGQLVLASGYLAIFLTPALLIIGVTIDRPYLAFGAVMLVYPLGRGVFGGSRRKEPVLWCEGVATVLDRLPVAFACFLLGVVVVLLKEIHRGAAATTNGSIGIGLSLWATMLFATCVAHDLMHRRDPVQAMCGHLVAGLAGYPMLGYEHLLHHARFGDTAMAEWPRVDESVWSFAARRLGRIVRDTLAPGCVLWLRQSAGFGGAKRLRWAVAISLVTWAAFAAAGGWAGFTIYLSASIGVAFGIQVMTYIQHWDLGDDNLPDGADRQYAWEDDCRFQAWLTLSISFHQAHHHAARQPFYRLTLEQGSPRQPAGYVVMMLISFVPGVWRRVMGPVLGEWRRNPGVARSAGRGLTCFSVLRGGSKKESSA